MKKYKKRMLTSVLMTVVTSMFAADMVVAQTTGVEEIEEIIVRVRKIEEPLQEVPLSISVLNEQEMSRKGIQDIRDVAKYSAGVIFENGFNLNDTKLTIRGLYPDRGRPNSAILIDGVDFTTEAVASAGGSLLFDQRLLDLQAIEIVKGPQSALYGRSAFAGAIQYVTRDPGEQLGGKLSASAGEYGRYNVSGSVDLPIADGLSALVNGAYWDDAHFHDDALTGGPLGGAEGYGFGAKVVYDAMDNIVLKARVSYLDDEIDPQATVFDRANTTTPVPASALTFNGGPIAPGPGVVTSYFSGSAGDRDGRAARLSANPRTGEPYPGGFREILTATFSGEFGFDFGDILILTGYLNGDHGQFVDGDKDALPNRAGDLDIARAGAEANSIAENEIFSQEIRYSTKLNGPFQFSTGGLYWREKSQQTDSGVTALSATFPPPPPGYYNFVLPRTTPGPFTTSRETDHWSIYGIAEWDVTEKITATFEGRYASETVDVAGPSCGFPPFLAFLCNFAAPSLAIETPPGSGVFFQPPLLSATDSKTDNYFAPKGTLEYAASDNVLLYFSAAQGIKPAGISTFPSGGFLDDNRDLSLEEATFEAEKLLTFEAGAKTALFDSALIFNSAFFLQRYSDRQVQVQRIVGGFPVPGIDNAARAKVFGIEIDGSWRLTDNLGIYFAYAFLDTENTEYIVETNSSNTIARAGNCTVTPDGLCSVNISGTELGGAPKHAFNAGFNYTDALGTTGLEWFIEGDIRYQGKRFFDDFNDRRMDSFVTSDLRIGVENERWDLIFFVNNVFDDDTIQTWSSGGGGIVETGEGLAFFPSSGFGYIPNPRHLGVRTNIRF